jgi:predicted TIM-barrel fold metal-dependent hydrolase
MGDWKCTRRTFIKAAGWMTVASVGGSSLPDIFATSSPQVVPNSSGTEKPTFKAPANACDCHIHIFDARFPMTGPNDSYVPDSSVASYRLFMKRIGTSRVVVVTPRPYVTDNRCTVDAIAQIGLSNARGVAVVHPEVTDAELKRLADEGIRGIRFTLQSSTSSVTNSAMIEPLAKRINELGWHVQFHLQAKQFVEHEDLLNRITAPMVFDHMARIPQINHPAFKIVCRLIDRGRTWIKLSGAYMESKIGPPNYADTSEVATAFLKLAPERMVWGSNWPHPTEKKIKPDDAVLFDLLPAWAPDAVTRKRILVDNPAVLYDFAQ